MAHIIQSMPDSGLGFHVKDLEVPETSAEPSGADCVYELLSTQQLSSSGIRVSIEHFPKSCGPPEYHLRSRKRLQKKTQFKLGGVTVERIWHIEDSQGQVMAVASRLKSIKPLSCSVFARKRRAVF